MNHAVAYRVLARNLSHASENKIHDDRVARRFGFEGALVPGVEIYAYMTHLAAARWGVDWLERGSAECRFFKPVYDGRFVDVSASATDAALALTVECDGAHCASGAATLANDDAEASSAAPAAPPPTPAPEPAQRPDADEISLAPGRRMSSPPLHLTADYLREYLTGIGETETLYAREQLVHPALMLRLANAALKTNVKLGPWIHAASSIRHCGLAHAGASLQAHAQVTANYTRKGHHFVDLDVIIVADAARAIAQLRHTVIYRLRQTD